MSIIINSTIHETTPAFQSTGYHDKGAGCKQCKYKTKRTEEVVGIVLHFNRGMKPGQIIPGGKNYKNTGETERGLVLSRYQAGTMDRKASWDFTVDMDGHVYQSNDPMKFYTWNANAANRHVLGIEVVQETNQPWNMYEAGLKSTVELVLFLTETIPSIPRVILCWDEFKGCWEQGPIFSSYFNETNYGSLNGIYGHRNISTNRGPGDPDSIVFEELWKTGKFKREMVLIPDPVKKRKK